MIVENTSYISDGKKGYAETIADLFIAEMERGTAPWQKAWTPPSWYCPDYNPVSSGGTPKSYKGVNSIYLPLVRELNGWEDPRWCTYLQASKNEWTIKKNSKATTVSFFTYKEKQIGIKVDKDGNNILDESGRLVPIIKKYPFFTYYSVFNFCQLDNAPELIKPPDEIVRIFKPNEDAELLLSSSGATILFDQVDRSFYKYSSDEIHLPDKSYFNSTTGYYETALHELGHWSGHKSRLNRHLCNTFGSPDYAREELRAEIASYMLSSHIGISFDPSSHASYVANWIEDIKRDPKELLNACNDAERILKYIINIGKDLSILRDTSDGKNSTERNFVRDNLSSSISF